MKVFAIIQCTYLGGMEQSALLLLDELKKMGHEVELLSLNETGELGSLLAQHSIPFSSLGYRGRWGWLSFLPLRRALGSKRADVMLMIGHNLMAMLALDGFCEGRRVLCMHFHHTGVKADWMWRIIYRVAMSRFQYIVYPSHFILSEAEGICPFLKHSKRTISYPIPLPVSLPPRAKQGEREATLAKLSIPSGSKIVGNAGWLIPRKRWDIFLQVAALVAQRVPESVFLVAGDGSELAGLKSLAKSLGIEDRVRWLGWQQNLVSFYHALDVLLFNSDWDAMGRTPLEALSHGVPIVASVTHGGLSEIINKEEFGFLIGTHDINWLAGKVAYLLQNAELARSVAVAGRRRVEEVGDPALHAMRIVRLFESTPLADSVRGE